MPYNLTTKNNETSPNKATRRKVSTNVEGKKRRVNPLKKRREKVSTKYEDEDDFYQEPFKRVIVPENQLQLSETQMKEEITRVLTGDDPNVPKSVSKFNFKDRSYKPDPPGQSDHMAVHFSMRGCALHVNSDEGKSQLERQKAKEEEKEKQQKTNIEKELQKNASDKAYDEEGEGEVNETNINKNQFNYSERAAQTFNFPHRERCLNTEPPPTCEFSDVVTQWEIHDSYSIEFQNSNIESNNVENTDKKKKKSQTSDSNIMEGDNDTMHSTKMVQALKLMERLANQNAQDDIFDDFKYWEDASDQYKGGEGSLLPLWRFSIDRTKRKQVTAVCWNPKYPDMFAVGYGSYEFMKQGSGNICCYSLKNTTFPEYMFSSESGVMSLDFHPVHSYLLAVGCYDGTVMVYDVCRSGTRPVFSSSIKSGQHTDPVWQVYWDRSNTCGKDLNFYSVSSDGRVINWSLSKNELSIEPVMQLRMVHNPSSDIEDQPGLSGLAGGLCLDFNKKFKDLFIVGTEEGNIYKCSRAYSGQYLKGYSGHHMAVYTVQWNPFHKEIFLSCSADWSVKVWDQHHSCPIMSFDLGAAVGDVSWSPYSSTVFAAVTTDGKIHVFDISVNKHEPLCEQKVVKRAKLTKIAFNTQDFVVIAGDDRGGVNSFKLSPNLRKLHSENKGSSEDEESQINKLEKVLSAADVKRPLSQ